MARTALLSPILTTLVFANIITGGRRALTTPLDPGYQIDVVREGQALNSVLTHLETLLLPGPVGGSSGKTYARPPQAGLSPDDLLEPFSLLYSYNDAAPAGNAYLVGQNSYAVKDYLPVLMGTSGSAAETEDLLSTQIVSFNGSIYLLGERFDGGAQTTSLHACVYRRSSTGQLHVIRRFDDAPISSREFDDERGSPCAAVHDGRLYIAYRSVEIGSNENRILVWRSDEDGLSFTNIATVTLANHPAPQGQYSSYRLRLASSGDSLMLASYGVCPVTRDGVDNLYRIRDARVFISYNDGYAFEAAAQDYRPFLLEDRDTVYARRSDSNFSSLFFQPDGDMDEDDFLRANVNFDLYFDEVMGAYVILKGADPTFQIGSPASPPVRSGNNRLIGICATPEDPDNWTACVSLDLNAKALGFQTSIDPLSYPEPTLGQTERDYAFWIYDLAVCSNGSENFILLTGASTSADDVWSTETIFTRFVMTPVQQLPKGFHDKILSYGSIVHPQFAFICDAFDIQQGGLFSIGDMRSDGTGVIAYEPALTIHEGSVWASVKQETGYFADQAPCFIVHGSQTALAEAFPNELSWSYYSGSIVSGNLQTITSGSVATGMTDDGFSLATSAAAATARLQLVIASFSILDRVILNRDGFFPFKSRVTMSATTPASQLEVWRCYLNNGSTGLSLRVFLTSTRDLLFKDLTGAFLSTTGSYTVPDGFFELFVYNGFGRSANGSQIYGAWVFVRAQGATEWIGPWLVDTISSAPGTAFAVGVVSYDTYGAGHTVVVKDVRFGTLGAGYRPYMRSYDLSDQLDEPVGLVLDQTRIPSKPVTISGNAVDLLGGPRLAFYGGLLTEPSRATFSYDRVSAINQASNITHPVASLVHDTTALYTAAQPPLYVFENERRQAFDTISLSNVVGITQFTLISGAFDTETETWTSPTSQLFNTPFMPLIITEQDGEILTIEQLPVETHRLLGQYAYVYNTDTGAFRTPQYKVIDNFDDVVVLDQAPVLGLNETIALTYTSFSFEVPEGIGSSRSQHIGLMLSAPGETELQLICLGNVEFGRMIEMTQTSMGLSESIESTSGLVTSTNGFSHTRTTSDKPLINKLSFEFYMTSPGSVRTLSALADMKSRSVYTALIYQDSEQDVTAFGHITALDVSNMAYDKTGSLAFTTQSFIPQPMPAEPDAALVELTVPAIEFSATTSYALQTSVITTDPFIVTWSFGDGTTDTGATVSHAWATAGRYTVTATVTLSTGPIQQRSILITVR